MQTENSAKQYRAICESVSGRFHPWKPRALGLRLRPTATKLNGPKADPAVPILVVERQDERQQIQAGAGATQSKGRDVRSWQSKLVVARSIAEEQGAERDPE